MKRAYSLAGMLLTLLLWSGCERGREAPTGQLFVSTEPAGATVLLNGQVLGVTPLSQKVPIGTHVVTVRREGFHVERFTINVAAGDNVSRDMRMRPVHGLVVIDSDPPGAAVSIGGVFQGNTPLPLHSLRLGPHRANLVLSGFNDKEVAFELDSRIPRRVFVEMDSNSGTLVVHSEPAGATVFLDGRNVGITPVSIDRVPQGERDVTVQLQGFASYRTSLLVTPDDTVRLDATLTSMPGSLEVVSNPSGARVFLNDQPRGETPLQLNDLDPGSYIMRVSLRGHADVTRTLRIGRGETVSEFAEMERNSGSLEIVTRPAGVRVIVNGEYAGTTRARGGSDVVSQPFQVPMLSQGFHTLQLVREGYAFESKRFSITRDEVTTLEETMRRLFIPNTLVRTGAGQDQVVTGVLVRRHLNGDIELEIREGIFRTILASEIVSVEDLRQEERIRD